jgi:hypothetical protein
MRNALILIAFVAGLLAGRLTMPTTAEAAPVAAAPAPEESPALALETPGVPLEAKCGDGKCSPPEDCNTCPQDCGKCCGDGKCLPPEDCNTCPQDCGPCKK